MARKNIEVKADECTLTVTADCGSSITYDKDTGRVTVDKDIHYTVFSKLSKELKRAINRESFNEDEYNVEE